MSETSDVAELLTEHEENLQKPSDPSPGPDVRCRVLDILNAVAPAVENLAGHQEQCDMDGVMVKVSRQALDEVLNAVNEVALVSALTRPLGGNIK